MTNVNNKDYRRKKSPYSDLMADLQIIYLFILLYLLIEIFKELLFPFSSSEI